MDQAQSLFGDRSLADSITSRSFRFFPEARRIAETFPSVEATVDAFASAGFKMEALESVPQVSAPSMQAFCERVRVRANSTLDPLGADEFARGMRALAKAAAR